MNSDFLNLETLAADTKINDSNFNSCISEILKRYDYQRTVHFYKMKAVFRARRVDCGTLDDAISVLDNIEQLSYPRSPEDNKIGRCNFFGKPVFYCSSDKGTPIFEIRPNLGNFISLTTFVPKEKDSFELTFPIIGVKQLLKSFSQRKIHKSITEMIEKEMNSLKPAILEIDNYFAELFVKSISEQNNYLYKITAAYFSHVNSCAVEGRKMDSLLYPSVESEISGYNLAIETPFVDRELIAKNTEIFYLESIDNSTYHLVPVCTAVRQDANGNIEWKKIKTDKRFLLNRLDPSPVFPFRY